MTENSELYRGKSTETGEWVQGYLFRIWEQAYILWGEVNGVPDMTEIDPQTVCKCTGLTDKNGRKIFEGDIVKYHFGEDTAPIKFGTYQSCFDPQHTEHCGFYVDWKSERNFRKDLGYWIHMVDAEIVGNTFDNPELVKGE